MNIFHFTKALSTKVLFAIGIISLLIMGAQLYQQSEPGTFAQSDMPDIQLTTDMVPFYKIDFASHESTLEVHSATAIELNDNSIMAFWYGGTREGHQDVSIYQNTWNNRTKQWGQEKSLLTRADTRNGTSRYIRKLGNPVVTRGSDNSIWLFYVSVSIGGWAGSSINLTQSHNEGKNWLFFSCV